VSEIDHPYRYTQLTLDLHLKDSFTFNNFISGDNELLVELLKNEPPSVEKQIYIWGQHNTGKTHLLQALCQHFSQKNLNVSFMPLLQLVEYSPEIFSGLEALDVCCIDDVQLLQNRPEWQESLFNLINRARDTGVRLVFCADQPADKINLQLKDLVSRLQWGPVFRLVPLNDAGKHQALQQRAQARGFELADNVVAYLLNNYNRNMADLFNMLDALDKAQLQQHRRLTLPFVKRVLGAKG